MRVVVCWCLAQTPDICCESAVTLTYKVHFLLPFLLPYILSSETAKEFVNNLRKTREIRPCSRINHRFFTSEAFLAYFIKVLLCHILPACVHPLLSFENRKQF